MRLGVIADIHGNDVALHAVLQDAEHLAVDSWRALGDLVSAPHATPADAAASPDLIQRYAAMAAGIGWTRGVLDQTGVLSTLTRLPPQLRLQLPSGATILGVHASPKSDDGPGIDFDASDDELRSLLALADCAADVVIEGHTHQITDRRIDGVRALNPGSAGLPRVPGMAGWLLLEEDEEEDGGHGHGLDVAQRTVPFDATAVVDDLQARRRPNAEFVASLLTGQRRQISHSSLR
jgi:putative phosphoesterase